MAREWHPVCAVGEIDEEDVRRFDHKGRTYAVYNTPKGYFATAGRCTHEGIHLADGLVIGDVIECPLHQGRFHIPSGAARGAPACVSLRTFPVKIESGRIFIEL